MQIPNEIYISFYEDVKAKFLNRIPEADRKKVEELDFNFWKKRPSPRSKRSYFEELFEDEIKSPKHFYNKYRDAVKATETDPSYQVERDKALLFTLKLLFGINEQKILDEFGKSDPDKVAAFHFQVYLEQYRPLYFQRYPHLRIYDRISATFVQGFGNKNDIIDEDHLQIAEQKTAPQVEPKVLVENDDKIRLDAGVFGKPRYWSGGDALTGGYYLSLGTDAKFSELIKQYYQKLNRYNFSAAAKLWHPNGLNVDAFREYASLNWPYAGHELNKYESKISDLETFKLRVAHLSGYDDKVVGSCLVYFKEELVLPFLEDIYNLQSLKEAASPNPTKRSESLDRLIKAFLTPGQFWFTSFEKLVALAPEPLDAWLFEKKPCGIRYNGQRFFEVKFKQIDGELLIYEMKPIIPGFKPQ